MSQQLKQIADVASQFSDSQSRFTWNFMQDFYGKVDAAFQLTQRLERNLHNANVEIQDLKYALATCQAELEAERRSHRAARDELQSEREEHNETDRLLKAAFEIAQESMVTLEDQENQIDDLERQLQIQRAKDQVKRLENC